MISKKYSFQTLKSHDLLGIQILYNGHCQIHCRVEIVVGGNAVM